MYLNSFGFWFFTIIFLYHKWEWNFNHDQNREIVLEPNIVTVQTTMKIILKDECKIINWFTCATVSIKGFMLLMKLIFIKMSNYSWNNRKVKKPASYKSQVIFYHIGSFLSNPPVITFFLTFVDFLLPREFASAPRVRLHVLQTGHFPLRTVLRVVCTLACYNIACEGLVYSENLCFWSRSDFFLNFLYGSKKSYSKIVCASHGEDLISCWHF